MQLTGMAHEIETSLYCTHPQITPHLHYGPSPHLTTQISNSAILTILQYSPPPTFGFLPIISPVAYLGVSTILLATKGTT